MCIFAGFKHLACPRNRVILSVYDKSFGNLGVILSYRYAIYIHMFFCLISHRYFPKMMVLTPKSSISRRFSTRGTPFMETPFWKSKVSAALDGKPWQLSQVPFRHRCRSGCGTESGLGTLGRQAVSAGNDDLVGGFKWLWGVMGQNPGTRWYPRYLTIVAYWMFIRPNGHNWF